MQTGTGMLAQDDSTLTQSPARPMGNFQGFAITNNFVKKILVAKASHTFRIIFLAKISSRKRDAHAASY